MYTNVNSICNTPNVNSMCNELHVFESPMKTAQLVT